MKPGVKKITLGAVMMVVGVLAPVLFVLPLLWGNSADRQFTVPGSKTLSVKKPGRYYVWNDFKTVHAGKIYNDSEALPSGVTIQVADSKGAALNFVGDSSMSSSTGDTSRKSIGYVDVPAAGQVSIQVTGVSRERVFSFYEFGFVKFVGAILAGVLVAATFVLVGLTFIILGVVKLVSGKR